ncbi:SDR family NAD(P)-dependent oxidoreductase [Uniformispora flossi]|uniref:SDR family NAD(P)-dependent oxidoreductase n=1 Tax=Uniformispora flossi TaxID=3390723 RepID=UPI003C2EBC0E
MRKNETSDLLGLHGRTAIVLGGALGLGRSVSRRLAEAGCKVAVADIADDAGESLVQEMRGAGAEALYLHTDARRRADVRRLIDLARRELGPLTVAVNVVGNPGGAEGIKPFLDMTEDDMRARLDLNFMTAFTACQEESLAMIEDGTPGRIVNFGSSSGLVGAPNICGYGAAKAAVAHFTISASMELARYGIRVNCVVPGTHVNPNAGPPANEGMAEFRRRAAAAPILGRLGEADETAGAALFLASDLSGYMTGHTVVSDGGVIHTTARPPVGMDLEPAAVRNLFDQRAQEA